MNAVTDLPEREVSPHTSLVPPPFQETSPSITTQSEVMQSLVQRLERFAQAKHPTLILGETGTGKELCARKLHEASPWSAGPFVAVNCAAIPRELMSAELFGCRPGAFTGAVKREGLLKSAHHGTLFLDEIGELSLDAQAVLLRALERREVMPVGSDQPRAVDFRLVCATHRNLAQMVKRKTFRADLYHRLSALTVEVPPLRARLPDLSALAYELSPQVASRIGREAWAQLLTYAWPGNIRELRNLLIRLECDRPEGVIKARHLNLSPPAPSSQALARPQEGSFLLSALQGEELKRSPQEWLDALTLKELITWQVVRAVERHEGISGAARVLQVSRNTIYRYLEVAFEASGLDPHLGEQDTAPPYAEPAPEEGRVA